MSLPVGNLGKHDVVSTACGLSATDSFCISAGGMFSPAKPNSCSRRGQHDKTSAEVYARYNNGKWSDHGFHANHSFVRCADLKVKLSTSGSSLWPRISTESMW